MSLLVFSAVLLGCVLVLLHLMPPSTAQAMGAASRAGSFVVATAQADSGTDLLWVAGVDVQRLVVYGADANGAITVLATADLRTLFQRQTRLSQTP